MIDFGKMSVIGFGPIQDEVFDWGLKGLNIIKAPNGSGKSKFINALVWCLYGKTLNGSVETWESVKPSNYNGTKVSVEFVRNGIDFEIIRCKDYKGKVHGAKGGNRLIVIEDGEISEGDKKDTKKDIEELVGYSFDLFKNSIVFGQKLKRLVSESGPNKKKLLDEAFNITFIGMANERASNKLKVLSEELSKIDSEKDKVEFTLESLKGNIAREREILVTFKAGKREDIRRIKEAIKDNENKIQNLSNEIKSFEKQIEEFPNQDSLLEGLESEKEKLLERQAEIAKEKYKLSLFQGDVEKLDKKIKTFEKDLKNVPTSCPHCNRPFDTNDIEEEKKRITTSKADLESQRSVLLNNIEQIKKGCSDANSVAASLINNKQAIEKININKKLLENLNYQIKTARASRRVFKTLIQKEEEKIEHIRARVFISKLEEYEKSYTEKLEELNTINSNYELKEEEVNDYKWLLNDPLSNSGLKAFIFNSLLEKVNRRLKYYTKFSQLKVKFFIDMGSARKDFETAILNYKGEAVPYDDLSGGQQQRVDIVTLFAIEDVLSETNNCSLLVMDELFESLDVQNIELLTELIQDKAKDKCLYLITHRHEFSPTNSNSIYLVYEDGVTSLER